MEHQAQEAGAAEEPVSTLQPLHTPLTSYQQGGSRESREAWGYRTHKVGGTPLAWNLLSAQAEPCLGSLCRAWGCGAGVASVDRATMDTSHRNTQRMSYTQ